MIFLRTLFLKSNSIFAEEIFPQSLLLFLLLQMK